MRIEKIIIKNYKSIEDHLIIEQISNLNILVGPNNAGKTNILDAMQSVIDTDLDNERFFDSASHVEIIFRSQERNYSASNIEGKISSNKDIYDSFIRINDTSSVYGLIPNKLEDFKRNFPEDYENFSKALSYYFKDVEINEKLFLLSVLSDNRQRSMKRMGEGFKRLFVILFYIFNPQYKIIFIDEPELHLHPSIIKKFLLLLREKKIDNQIFLTTHHPTFVQADHLIDMWRVARNKNGSTSVYRFTSKNINLNRFVQEINDDNSGMLFSDKVLLVEGVSDRIFMTEMIGRFYKKDKDIKVVYTGGKGTIDLYAELCDMFNIPYAVMVDSDALTSLVKLKKYPSFGKHKDLREKLKKEEIFVLNRDLENVYPHQYKRRETKPLSALFVSRRITKKDLQGKRMEIIKEILETI